MTIAALMLSGLSSYDRARACVESWLPTFDWWHIHSYAPDPQGTLPITKVGTREGPRSCFLKRIMGMAMARTYADFNFLDQRLRTDWFHFCSDDNYVWRQNLEDVLIKHDPEAWSLIGGHTNVLKIADGTMVRYPSGGGGYSLSRAALDHFVLNMPAIYEEWIKASNNDDIEDAFIGWACARLGIPYYETPGFYGCNPGLPGIERRACERGCVAIEKPISFHYMTADQMRTLHAMSQTDSANHPDRKISSAEKFAGS